MRTNEGMLSWPGPGSWPSRAFSGGGWAWRAQGPWGATYPGWPGASFTVGPWSRGRPRAGSCTLPWAPRASVPRPQRASHRGPADPISKLVGSGWAPVALVVTPTPGLGPCPAWPLVARAAGVSGWECPGAEQVRDSSRHLTSGSAQLRWSAPVPGHSLGRGEGTRCWTRRATCPAGSACEPR